MKHTIQELMGNLQQRGSRFDPVALKQHMLQRPGADPQKVQHMFEHFLEYAQGDRLMLKWHRAPENQRWFSRPSIMTVNNLEQIILPEPGTMLVNISLIRCEADLALQLAGLSDLARQDDLHARVAEMAGLERQHAKMGLYKLLYGMHPRSPEVQAVAAVLRPLVDYSTDLLFCTPAGTVVQSDIKHVFGKFLQISVTEIVDRWLEKIGLDFAMRFPDGALLLVPTDQPQTLPRLHQQCAVALVEAFQEGALPAGFGLHLEVEICGIYQRRWVARD